MEAEKGRMFFEVKNYVTMQEAIESMCAFLSKQGVHNDNVFDSKLVAYELLGNILKHADGRAQLACHIVEDFVEMKIYTEKIFVLPTSPGASPTLLLLPLQVGVCVR